MKKLLSVLVILALLCSACLLMTACGKDSGKTKIAIVQPLSHASLDQIRDSIIAELEAAGRDDIEIVTENANNDNTALNTIFSNLKADGADIIVPIATAPAATAKAVFAGTDTPIVFAAVTNPGEAGLTGNDCANITGVSDRIPAEEVIRLIQSFQPDCKKLGLLYTSGEVNSVAQIAEVKDACDAAGIAYEEASIGDLSELQNAVNSLVEKGVEAFYTGTDNNVASAMTAYTDIAYAAKLPVYCGADSMVSDGGFATIGVDYVLLSKQVAQLVLKIVDGQKPADLPYETLNEFAKFVNLQAADKIGFELTAEQQEQFAVLVEKDGTNHFNTQE